MTESAKPRVCLSWSTGKDSAWTLHRLRGDHTVDLVALMSTVIGDGESERVAMHGIRLPTLRAQAAAAGLPVMAVPLPDPCSNADYEKAMLAFVERAKAEAITHVAFGDLFLEDVRRYREKQMAGTGLAPLFPIWGLNTRDLAREMVASGLRARIVSVDLQQIGEDFLGREFDDAFLDDLPESCDPCGENGEFHTFTYAGPMFTRPLAIELGRVRRSERFVHIEPCALEQAPPNVS